MADEESELLSMAREVASEWAAQHNIEVDRVEEGPGLVPGADSSFDFYFKDEKGPPFMAHLSPVDPRDREDLRSRLTKNLTLWRPAGS